MNDSFEDRLASRLAARAAAATPVAEFEAVMARVASIDLKPAMPAGPSHRRSVWAAAALLIVVGLGVVAARAVDRTPDTTGVAVPAVPIACGLWLSSRADATTIADAGASLRARADVADLRYVDQMAAYQEFTAVFANHQALIDSVSPVVMPPSWRFETTTAAERIAADLASIAGNVGVHCASRREDLATTLDPSILETHDAGAPTTAPR